MPRYRKRPIEVDAIRFTGENWEEVQRFTGERAVQSSPSYTIPLFDRVENQYTAHDTPEDGVKKGDYIIRGLKGECYPHDGDLFATAYEEVEHYNDHDPLV